ncbi:MAG: hypothetical protein GY811_21290 [Myxococcales bacterium]|nr:hypothetical protein [Myxococcales bacterium]
MGRGHEHRRSSAVYPWTGTNKFRSLLTIFRKSLGAETEVSHGGSLDFLVTYGASDASFYKIEGKTLYSVGSTSEVFPGHFKLPSGGTNGYLDLSQGRWSLVSGRDAHSLEFLPSKERDSLVDGASFAAEPKWKREPYLLARDSRGAYYYADRYSEDFGGKRYRVVVGRRGQLKLTRLKRLVEDSEGTLFSTDSGDLRLVVSGRSGRREQTAMWIRGRKKTPLTPVKVRTNLKLIYDELGVYYGDDLGFLCE